MVFLTSIKESKKDKTDHRVKMTIKFVNIVDNTSRLTNNINKSSLCNYFYLSSKLALSEIPLFEVSDKEYVFLRVVFLPPYTCSENIGESVIFLSLLVPIS